MATDFTLEVPELAARACSPGSVCNDCCGLFNNPACRQDLGLNFVPLNVIGNCKCHDICVEDVTHVCAIPVRRILPYPPVGRCRLGPDITFPALTPGAVGRVIVTCAEEVLDPGCSSVSLRVGLVVVFGTGANAIALPTCIEHTCNFNDFVTFPGCVTPTLQQFLRAIRETDGSCILVQLSAGVNAAGNAIIIEGSIIEKLWKHENLWVMAIRPYELNDRQRDLFQFTNITVKEEFTFPNQFIPTACNDLTCP